MPHSLFIDIPENFSFRSTIYSHGWCELAPFEIDLENWRLSYVFNEGKTRKPVGSSIFEEAGRLRIDLDRKPANEKKIVADVRHLLRLDDDIGGFYESVAGHDRLDWVVERRAGRMLRSPTVFEDLVKTICTTNCSWALTKLWSRTSSKNLGQSERRLAACV